MKTLALALLGALLLTMRAQGLRCYKCSRNEDLDPCEEETCFFPSGVCISQDVTVIWETSISKLYNRYCFESCPAGYESRRAVIPNAKMRSNNSCCSKDLCNTLPPKPTASPSTTSTTVPTTFAVTTTPTKPTTPKPRTNRVPAGLAGFLLSVGVSFLTTLLC